MFRLFNFARNAVTAITASLPTVKRAISSVCTALGVILVALEAITA